MYSVEIAKPAQRDLDRIRGADLARIEAHILALESDPRPRGVKKLQDILYRVRVGDWRILYAIEDGIRNVTILRILRRNEATYRRL